MGSSKAFILCLCFALICSVNAIQNPIFLDENFESGFIDISSTSDLYYIMFESRSEPSTDPLVLWLNGGPGCSSLLGLFEENGPYKITNETTLESNPFSWNNKANLIYVDQPVGTGFSHAGFFDLVSTERGVARDFYEFLTKFFALYPQFAGRDFYISGESYAGQYIPAIASKILDEANPIINLKGIAIGNGWVDPYYQQPAYAEYAYANKLISESTFKSTLKQFEFCQFLIKLHTPSILASIPCSLPYEEIVGTPSRFNVYDIRVPCDGDGCYQPEDEKIERFTSRKDVQEILGTGKKQWKPCVNNVNFALSGQENRSAIKQVIQALNSKIKVLIYSGDQDFQCNYIGAEKWAYHMKWSGQSQFQQTEYSQWTYEGVTLGQKKVVDNLSFLIVNGAGHQVPMDTPASALVMIEQFIYSSFNQDTTASE